MLDSHLLRHQSPSVLSYFSLNQFLFLTAFLVIFTARYALIPYFHQLTLVDGSWQYALTRLLKEGKFLGVDCFFTYGPLAQYLGPINETDKLENWIGVIFKITIILFFFVCVRNLATLVRQTGPVPSISFFLMALVFLSLFPHLQAKEDLPYNILIFLTYLNFHLTYEGNAIRNKYLYILLFLAVTLTQFKFSLGLHATASLSIVCILLTFREGWKWPTFLGLAWITGGILIFHLLTGHWNFPRFWELSMGVTSAYSEIMALHLTASPAPLLMYPMALLTVLFFICLGTLWADKYLHGKPSQISLVTCIALTGFFLFKNGFVRADSHTLYFYQSIFLLTIILAGLLLVQGHFRRKETWIAAVFLLLSLHMWSSYFRMYVGSGPFANFRQAAYESWINEPIFITHWLKDPRLMTQRFEAKRHDFLFGQYPRLLSALTSISQDKPGLTITFSPWNLMLAAALPGFKLIPMPSLQIYSAAAQPALGDLDLQFLSSPTRPDIIVMEPEACDYRNLLSDYTYWVEPLLSHYISIGMFDGQVIFIQNETAISNPLRRSPTGPGSFLRLQAKPLGFFQSAAFAAGKILFKPPELTIIVDAIDTHGHEKVIVSQGFYSQLKHGIYFSDLPASLVLGSEAVKFSKYYCFQAVKSAIAIRKSGYENLPILPKIMPLKVEFCLKRNSLCKD
jgi:hypothetical protein